MAAFYTPNPTSRNMGIDLPFDLETGFLNDEVWEKWKLLDPARNIRKHLTTLSGMDGIYLDVGSEDEFKINFGMRKMHRVLEENKIGHIFEEFPDGHFNIAYRYEKSLEFLAAKLS